MTVEWSSYDDVSSSEMAVSIRNLTNEDMRGLIEIGIFIYSMGNIFSEDAERLIHGKMLL